MGGDNLGSEFNPHPAVFNMITASSPESTQGHNAFDMEMPLREVLHARRVVLSSVAFSATAQLLRRTDHPHLTADCADILGYGLG